MVYRKMILELPGKLCSLLLVIALKTTSGLVLTNGTSSLEPSLTSNSTMSPKSDLVDLINNSSTLSFENSLELRKNSTEAGFIKTEVTPLPNRIGEYL